MVAPSVYAPDLPVSLEKIILKCTQKSQKRRYATMGELLVDLKFAAFELYCRFQWCSHISEPDCGVKQELAQG